MNRALLKHTLKQQTVPMSQAVAQKLAYLQSDDVFSTENVDDYMAAEAEDENTDDFAGAFGGVTPQAPKSSREPTYAALSGIQQATAPRAQPETFAEHKQSIAEKIAALRGIKSMPGEYLNNKI